MTQAIQMEGTDMETLPIVCRCASSSIDILYFFDFPILSHIYEHGYVTPRSAPNCEISEIFQVFKEWNDIRDAPQLKLKKSNVKIKND